MKTIHTHESNDLNKAIVIEASEPETSGASSKYQLYLTCAPGVAPGIAADAKTRLEINFHHGAIPEKGFNGFTNEALLAVLIDRMQGFQSGQFKSRENAIALTHLEEALMWLQKRSRERQARGVEGTHTV